MKRKEFLNWAGISFLASFFPVALAACSDTSTDRDNNSSQTSPELADTPARDGFVFLGTSEELQATGYLQDKKSRVIVVQDSNRKPLAVTSVCTHQGCTVEWKKDSSTLVCPCHDAKYAPDGKVLGGPAKGPLSSYEVKEEGGKILVKVA